MLANIVNCHLWLLLKGQFTPKAKHPFLLLPVVLFISLDSFGELSSFGDFGRRDFCIFPNIMGHNGALNVVPKSSFEKLISNISFHKHKIIHRPCCEMFYISKKVVLVSKKVVPIKLLITWSVDYLPWNISGKRHY